MTPRPPRQPSSRARWIERLDDLEASGDRRATLPLLDLFLQDEADGGLDDETAGRVADVLAALEDPRAAPAVLAAALDGERPSYRRALAVQVLAALPADDPPRADCLRWSAHRDPVLRSLGVQYMDVPDAARIVAAVSDPDVLVRRTAAEALGAIVRTRPLVEALRRALRDDDAVVREIACRVALFDEPLDVSRDLLALLGDPSRAVRAAAIEALEWYPRVSVLLGLMDARGPGAAASGPADADLRGAIGSLLERFTDMYEEGSPAVRRALERWARPVAWIFDEVSGTRGGLPGACAGGTTARMALNGWVGPGREVEEFRARRDADGEDPEDDEEFGADAEPFDLASALARADGRIPPPPAVTRRPPVDLAEAARRLDQPDTPGAAQRAVLVMHDWSGAGARGLALLRRCAASGNWSLRQMSALAFADLLARRDLAALGRDREPVVRRSAFLAATNQPDASSPDLLAAARETLADPAARPTAGDPALALLSAGAPEAEVRRLVVAELSTPDDRDGLWLGAIGLARYGNLRTAAGPLREIVARPVEGSVRAHLQALEALRSLGVPRSSVDLTAVSRIDHADVVAELAHWEARSRR